MNNLTHLKQKAVRLLDERLKLEQSNAGQAHNKSHLIKTAELSQLIGKIYGFGDRELFLSYFASLFHDIVRSTSEDSESQDEKLSADQAVKTLKNATLEERQAVHFAIENHGHKPSWKKDSLKEKVHLALFVADKMEQNGVRVIARRSSFVAGERLSEQGDLPLFGFKSNKDELLVMAIESITRLTFVNPEGIYPTKLKVLVAPLYRIQRQFVLGLFKALELSIEDIAKILINTKRGDGKNLLQFRGINVNSEAELVDLIEKIGGITNKKIQSVSDDLKESAIEAVLYFSSKFKKDLDKIMINWKPQNKIAKDWHRQMVEYLDGTCFNSITI